MRYMRRFGWLAVAIAVILIGNAVNSNLKDYVQDVIQQCGFAIILAVSLNIVNGLTGQFSIGHAGFMAVGAYTGASVTYQVAQHSAHNAAPGPQWMLAAMVVGGLCSALAGYVVGVPSLRLRGDYLAIVTLGFGEIIRVVLENITDISPSLGFTGGATGFQNIPSLSNFIIVFGTALLIIVLARNLKFSSHGLAFMSIREDEVAADAMGVNTTAIKVTAFVLSAFFAGVGGVLFAHAKAFKPDTFSFILSINYVVMVVLGGSGSITGATLAAIVLTLLPELLKPVKDQIHFTDEFRQVIYALLLVLMMILRPTGVFGTGELSFAGLGRWIKRGKSPVDSLAQGMAEEAEEAIRDTSPAATNGTSPNLFSDGERAYANVDDELDQEEPAAKNHTARNGAKQQARTVVLDVSHLTKKFGGIKAVEDVNIRLEQGELVGLIGPNGAGKTTVFNMLTGVYEPSEGNLEFEGQPLAGQRPFPATPRALWLALDTFLAAFGGWIISTILATAMVPSATTPEAAHLQGALRWIGPIAGIAISLATMSRSPRRKYLAGMKPYRFAQRGISRTFQNIRLFSDLTVLENVRIGMYLRRKTNLFDAMFRTARLEREEAAGVIRARRLLQEFNLLGVENVQAKNLAYGDQRRLEIVRALATDPHLLLLDEPAAGMNPQEKAQLMRLIRRVRDEYSLTILLIEHDMKLVMGICERIYVLDYGKIIAEGAPQEIRSNPTVIAAYLGNDDAGDKDAEANAKSEVGTGNAAVST